MAKLTLISETAPRRTYHIILVIFVYFQKFTSL